MALKICLDPGHGRYDNKSPNKPEYVEGAQMFYLAQKLKAELEKRGFEVLITRQKIDENPSLADRGAMAGKNGCCMFLSLHSNSPAHKIAEDGSKYYEESVTGTVVYYSMTRPENKDLGDRLGNAVAELMGHYFRGSKTKEYPNRPGVDYYGVIRNAAQSGCSCAFIIEHGFHTHVADAEFLLKEENQQKIAELEGIEPTEEEINNGLSEIAAANKVDVETIKRFISLEDYITDIKVSKAVGLVKENAVVDNEAAAKTEEAAE